MTATPHHPALAMARPVAIVGGGPVGLATALGLAHHGIACVVFEEDAALSLDTKAGTVLARTLEIFHRYGVADDVLAQALRVDEIGEIDRRTQASSFPLNLGVLAQETRYPFVINLPQQDLEPILAAAIGRSGLARLHLKHRLARFDQHPDHVVLHLETPDGPRQVEAAFLLACDGGRSTVREQLGVTVDGTSLAEKYSLVDLVVDLDIENPRDYPYLAYFSDPEEWMVLVRHPHCWRFLYPLPPGVDEPSDEALKEKSLRFIGQAQNVRLLNKVVYKVHHRVASRWRDGRVFLMGDAAHLITPMWALGLNTGALDASNLPWRLSWFLRGWAGEHILDGYESEQKPLALKGSGEMAEAARLYMSKRGDAVAAMSDNNWSNAATRAMLSVRLDVAGTGSWSMVAAGTTPPLAVGDRLPDYLVHTGGGVQQRIHDVCVSRFTALYFCDVRRRPALPPNTSPALAHYAVSSWDAPLDSGLRAPTLFDPGNILRKRLGVADGTLVLVRPDHHVAAIVPITSGAAQSLYQHITGRAPGQQEAA